MTGWMAECITEAAGSGLLDRLQGRDLETHQMQRIIPWDAGECPSPGDHNSVCLFNKGPKQFFLIRHIWGISQGN